MNKNTLNQHSMMHVMRRSFTLIELLIVVAIIIILAAMLLPALGQVKKISARTQCISNIKSHGTAFSLYGADYNDYFPFGGHDESIDKIKNGTREAGKIKDWTLNRAFHPFDYRYSRVQPQTKLAWYYFERNGISFFCPGSQVKRNDTICQVTYRVAARDVNARLNQAPVPDSTLKNRIPFRFQQIRQYNPRLILYGCVDTTDNERGSYFVASDASAPAWAAGARFSHHNAFLSLFQDFSVHVLPRNNELSNNKYFDWSNFRWVR